MPQRQLTPYELNQLRKYHLDYLDPNSLGEKPIEYVTGHVEFCQLDFLVDPSVLIPRLESEQIVSIANSFLVTLPQSHLDIADIGTGSGCLGISLAHSLTADLNTNFDLWFSDISDAALNLAKTNAARLIPNLENKLHFLKSDLFSNYPPVKFDLIMANLPYIPSTRLSSLDDSVKDYEPVTALDGGPTGAEIINRLLSSIEKFLKPVFQIILEIDTFQTLDQFIIPQKFQAKIVSDCFGRPRFLIISPTK